MEQPTLQVLRAPAQYLKDAVATKATDGTWTFSLRLPAGFYYLIAAVPKNERGPGCSHLEQFAVLPGHDRHLVGALAGSYIGGEGFDRSLAGTIPFEGLIVTQQPLDYPTNESSVAVDGLMYDAESLGPHPYLLRFYLPGSRQQFTSFEIDFQHTPAGSHLQRNLTLDDIRTGLRDESSGPFWTPGGQQVSPTFQIFDGSGAAAQAMAVAFADLREAKQLRGAAAHLDGYFIDERTQNPLHDGEKRLFFIEFIPKAKIDDTHRLILDSGACVRNGRPRASYVVREDMVIMARNLCIPNP